MLGMVFTEFLEMVEDRFSPEMVDAILDDVPTAHGGAYTAVGYYPHQEVVALVLALSRRSGVPVETLLHAFGKHLFGRLAAGHPQMFARHGDLFDLLEAIDGQIHIDVRKLYEHATPPRVTVLERDPTTVRLLYQSPRKMDTLALGLIEGAAAHFETTVEIRHEPWSEGTAVGTMFIVRRC
jgi:hypothetical protein